MASGDVPPQRPRRERPLVAPGRDRREDPLAFDPSSLPPPTMPPPTARPPAWVPGVAEPPPPDASQRADHVWVSFTGPLPQRRSTVAFRLVLAFPHFLWMGLLGVGWAVVAFASWFAALFTGEVPYGMARFLAQVVQYQSRVTAYGYLLMTDQYPPFELAAPDYALNLFVAPQRLNPAAVFFRFILMIPSALLSAVLLVGAQIVSIVAWLLTLVIGRLPTPLWEANAAVLRYQARAAAFASMLTAEQPGRPLGDRAASAPLTAPLAPVSQRPRIFRLRLSTAARRLVVLFGVVAVVTYVSLIALTVVTASRVSNAVGALEDAHDELVLAVERFESDEARCAETALPDCARDASETLADEFEQFADDVAAIEFGEIVSASILAQDAEACASALRRMSAAPSLVDYQAAYFEYQTAYETFDEDYRFSTFDVQTDA